MRDYSEVGMSFLLKIFLTFVLLFQANYLCAQTLQPVSGRALDVNSIIPADVAARILLLKGELELIRQELGKPKKNFRSIEVTGASPREVYQQAISLFAKSNRLAFEQTRYTLQAPDTVVHALVRPYHVWLIIDQALQRVLAAKIALNIPEITNEIEQAQDITPSDVYRILTSVNQLTNSLLTQSFTPGDVYQVISTGINSMESILATFPHITSKTELPAFERKKTPNDVYEQLVLTSHMLEEIAELSSSPILKLKNARGFEGKLAPSDVYDLSITIVTNTNYLLSLKKPDKIATKAGYTPLRTPSYVYQHVVIFKRKTRALLAAVKNDPTWLNH